jgi:hypothetical protein
MNWFVSEAVVMAGHSVDGPHPFFQGKNVSYLLYSDGFSDLTFTATTTQTLY